mmetsp:Transcript_33735/g.52090  ORF Transcript_33735/g.52090 Transcript_33735/m.52090 type:complete len:100 (+) Transcript_33735:313-612(+)
MEAKLDETNKERDIQHLKVADKLVSLYMKFGDDIPPKGSVGNDQDQTQYWPQLAAVIIKSMKSQTLQKLVEKVENFRQAIEQSSDNEEGEQARILTIKH